MPVVVLNASYEVLNVVTVKRAVIYVLKEKAEIVHADPDQVWHSASRSIQTPRIVRMLKYVRIPTRRRTMAWSKRGVIRRDNRRCGYCGHVGTTVDHILPTSRGGQSTWLNTVCCCTDCNNRKDDRTPTEARMPLRITPTTPEVTDSILVTVGADDRTVLRTLGVAVPAAAS